MVEAVRAGTVPGPGRRAVARPRDLTSWERASARILGTRPTDHELEVFALYVRLGSTSEAAGLLGLSHDTVRNTLETLRRRLGVGTSIEALALLDDTAPGWRPPFDS